MGIFGRKKEREGEQVTFPPKSSQPEHREQKEIPVHIVPPTYYPHPANLVAPSHAVPVHRPKEGADEQPAFAPLFVKLTRYRQILSNINQIKYSVSLIRNQVMIMNELEALRSENMKILQAAIDNVNKRLTKLDSDFMRPTGFMDSMQETHVEEMETLEGTITDLRDQISGLKEEVETYG